MRDGSGRATELRGWKTQVLEVVMTESGRQVTSVGFLAPRVLPKSEVMVTGCFA